MSPLVGAARGRLGEETRSDRDREVQGGEQIGKDRQRAKETEPRRASHLLGKEMNVRREKTLSLATEAAATRRQRAKQGEEQSAFSRPLATKCIAGNPRKPQNVPCKFMQIYQIR